MGAKTYDRLPAIAGGALAIAGLILFKYKFEWRCTGRNGNGIYYCLTSL